MAHLRDLRALTLDAAKTMAAAAERFAIERGWTIAVAVVDAAGGLILLQGALPWGSGPPGYAVVVHEGPTLPRSTARDNRPMGPEKAHPSPDHRASG